MVALSSYFTQLEIAYIISLGDMAFCLTRLLVWSFNVRGSYAGCLFKIFNLFLSSKMGLCLGATFEFKKWNGVLVLFLGSKMGLCLGATFEFKKWNDVLVLFLGSKMGLCLGATFEFKIWGVFGAIFEFKNGMVFGCDF
ncbi:hypothetical protein [Photobacterium kishitanii]|uniref:Uncharacterized protein n=1 Tax=Photobacterium kishitanii TaxID=318456 RepID=A0A2T3KLS0_9GAMM|nr:hypothetical protein [Photobacterium kishitanii]PSV00642.1 hypothetical protein C9J27_05755 [Photobacterium kishitanii]